MTSEHSPTGRTVSDEPGPSIVWRERLQDSPVVNSEVVDTKATIEEQPDDDHGSENTGDPVNAERLDQIEEDQNTTRSSDAVSYTHLTLPTKRIV